MAAWIVGAAISVGVGLLALSLVGDDLASSQGPSPGAGAPAAGPSVIATASPTAAVSTIAPSTGPAPGGATVGGAAPGGAAPGADRGAPTRTAPAGAPPPGTGGPATTTMAPPVDRRISTAGGDVLARCGTGGSYLVGWSPAPGFRADHVQRGPAAETRVEFESDGRDVKLRITCVGGVPQAAIEDHRAGPPDLGWSTGL